MSKAIYKRVNKSEIMKGYNARRRWKPSSVVKVECFADNLMQDTLDDEHITVLVGFEIRSGAL